MTMTTRVLSFDLAGPAGDSLPGEVVIQPNVPELVDTADNTVYVAEPKTYSLAVGVTDPLLCTDNIGTSPAAGQWGYTLTVKLPPGVPDVSVSAGLLPTGSGSYSLAAMIAAAEQND